MSRIEIMRRGPSLSPLASRLVYETALASTGAHRSALLQARAPALRAAIGRAVARSADIHAPGEAARHLLKRAFGQTDEALLRGAICALALGLDACTADWPAELRELRPAAHARLAGFLAASRPYNAEAFARDVAFAAGLLAPMGSLSVLIPTSDARAHRALDTRRAGAAFCRQVLQYGAAPAQRWLAEVGRQPWAELHLDLRTPHDFNSEGFIACYHRLAALMRARKDLAGVYGASWLYDPALAHVSPGLAFVRRTAEDGGSRLIRLRADPVQTAFAVARSPLRRKMVASGAYRPVCYGMFWTRSDLIAWSESARTDAAAPVLDESRLQVVRK